jgi:excisionase family DNA binding protein
MSEDGDTMTPEEVAAYLRVHRITVYRLIDNGTLHAFKVGRSWRFNRSEIAALAAGRKSN